MKKLLIAIELALLFLSPSAFSAWFSSSPEDVAKEYVEALCDRDFKKSYELEFHDIPIEYGLYYELMRRQFTKKLDADVSVVDVKKLDQILPGVDTAVVVLTIQGTRAKIQKEYTLINVDGWKVLTN